MEENLRKHVACATDSMRGGFLQLDKPEADVLDYETLFMEAEFLKQVKKQVFYEGFGITLEKLIDTTVLKDAAAAGELYQEQEAVQKEAANVTTELLRLMTLVDGISTGDQGILPDKQGKPATEGCFIKQLAPMSADELRSALGNDRIYHALSPLFIYPRETGEAVFKQLSDALEVGDRIAEEEERIGECEFRLRKISEEKGYEKRE